LGKKGDHAFGVTSVQVEAVSPRKQTPRKRRMGAQFIADARGQGSYPSQPSGRIRESNKDVVVAAFNFSNIWGEVLRESQNRFVFAKLSGF